VPPPPPPKAPAVPEGSEDAMAASGPLVQNAPKRPRELEYTRDEKHAFGNLRGICRIKGGENIQIPAKQPYEPEIKNVKPGEADYYKNIKIIQHSPLHWLKPDPRHKFLLTGVALYFKGIRTGRRPPLDRPGFAIGRGMLTCERLHGYGLTYINFGPPMERAQFGTGDTFPCDLVLKRIADGKIIFEGTASAYQDDKLKPGEQVDPRRFSPKLLQAPPLTEMGQYALTCARHPWQFAYLVVTDNPYATVADGEFTIIEIPPGKHVLQAWHPAYQAVEKDIEVEIKEAETQEVVVEFNFPPVESK